MGSNGYEAEREQLLHDGREAEAGEIDPAGAPLAEQQVHVENLTAEPVQYRVLVPVDDVPRFGGRLRAALGDTGGGWASCGGGLLSPGPVRRLREIADAIDQDAGDQIAMLGRDGLVQDGVELQFKLARAESAWAKAEWDAEALRSELETKSRALELVRADLRRQVEEAVGRLSYAVTSPNTSWGGSRPGGQALDHKDVIDVGPFLAELDSIFGRTAQRRKIDRREWDRLLQRLDLYEGAPLAMVLDEVHCKLDVLGEANNERFRLEQRIEELDNAEHPPDDMAARLVHASHSGAYLVDLSLCPHPDCERLWGRHEQERV